MSEQLQNDHQPSMAPSSVEDLRPELNGLIVYQPGTLARYLVDRGYKCLLHNFDLFKPNKVEIPYDINTITTGHPVAADAAFIRADANGEVFLVDFDPQPTSDELFARPIQSAEIFNRYQFNWDAIRQVPKIVIQALPKGLPLAPPTPAPTPS
jgi:hypothetical protein